MADLIQYDSAPAPSKTEFEALSEQVTSLNSKITNFITTGRQTDNINLTNTFTYTGLSVTIPAGKAYGIRVSQQYNTIAPDGVALCLSSTSLQNYNSQQTQYHMLSLTGYTVDQLTVYFWAKAIGSGKNNVYLDYWYTN